MDRVEGSLTDEYKEEGATVIYHYNKIKYGNLIIRHVDKSGNIIEKEQEKQEIGTKYSLKSIGKEIPGYTFEKVEGELTGEYKLEDTIVTYIYDKMPDIETGRVIIKYVDENEATLEEVIKTGIVNDPYTFQEEVVKKDIPEYSFKEISGELTGQYKKEDTIIFCRYEKIKYGKLIVVCIDENNNIIKRDVTTERVGTDYNLGKVGEEIEGYTFLGIEGKPVGKYKLEDTIVTYRYQKNEPQGPSTEKVTLPKTGQFIYIYIILGVVILGLLFFIISAKKRKKDDKIEDKKK